jgi:hypothetical protein
MTWTAPNAIVSSGFVLREGEDEYDLKMQFAAIVAANPQQALMAGYVLFKGPENYGRAMQAQQWLSDPIVQSEVARLAGDHAPDLLPTEDQIKLATWNVAQQASDMRVKLQALELLSKQTGILKTPGEGSGGGNVLIQNVIKLPNRVENDRDEELFRARFEAQQLKLVRDARSPSKG